MPPAAPNNPRGRTHDIARVLSVGQDSKTGEAVLPLEDREGRTIALRLGAKRFATLAKGVLGLAVARGDIAEIK